MLSLPLIHYPTTLYWIDDDALFLEIATERFQEEHKIKISYSPNEAIIFFTNYQRQINPLMFLQSCTNHEDYDLADHHPVDIEFSAIRQIKNNQEKINDIAIIIIDYSMPDMTGIELCKQLKYIPAKKILLTGTADFQQAVNAFNQGVIDCFICKDDPDLATTLSNNVARLSAEYFAQQTMPLLNHIQAGYFLPQSDPVFINFFQILFKNMSIQEYYLNEKNGGMTLISSDKHLYYLAIQTDRTLDNFIEFYENTHDTVFFIKHIKNRSQIPFFVTGQEAWEVDITSWSNYFYTPKLLKGRENYYWALITENNSILDIEKDN